MKTKFFTILTLFLLIGTIVLADNVSIEEAKQVATNFYFDKMGVSQSEIVFSEEIAIQENNINLYYVFNITENRGFVIVSADDLVKPIIAYSDMHTFETENQPENISTWMSQYKKQIIYVKNNNYQATNETLTMWKTYKVAPEKFEKPINKNKSVAAMCDNILWNQDDGWNMQCPEDENGPGEHAYAGCGATAMSIIMYYWQYPIQGFSEHAYYHPWYGNQSVNFGETTYFWANMDDVTPTYSAAKLMYHCGVSIDMLYGSAGSAALSSKVPNALDSFFCYQDCEFVQRADYSNPDWIALLKSELDEGRPIYYAGQSTQYGSHAFVCSGYDNSDSFHFNFGWSGQNNGYYAIDGFWFNEGNEIVINIAPDPDNTAYPYENPAQNVIAELIPTDEETFEVDLEWQAPEGQPNKSITGYQIYRGEEEIAILDNLTFTYTDNELPDDIANYYAVRALYDTNPALCASDYVEGYCEINFYAIDPDTQGNINQADITFNEETKTTNFLGASFTVPYGFNYFVLAEHDDYPTTGHNFEVLYQDTDYDIIMDGSGVYITPHQAGNISIYPNPSNNGIFNVKNNNSQKIDSYTITDINGKIIQRSNFFDTNTKINLSELSNGIYIINYNIDKKIISQKLIIQ